MWEWSRSVAERAAAASFVSGRAEVAEPRFRDPVPWLERDREVADPGEDYMLAG
ncbi:MULTISPECIES: hypothetical protein [unclassified Nocardia]|uniref:hypothetical protein n=1 Tax=unclassified Nocardia TaxID=2637762 RepID=UPI001CE3C1DF|nr:MULTISPECIES: hypothetical protein [unclassified Nocardia]